MPAALPKFLLNAVFLANAGSAPMEVGVGSDGSVILLLSADVICPLLFTLIYGTSIESPNPTLLSCDGP